MSWAIRGEDGDVLDGVCVCGGGVVAHRVCRVRDLSIFNAINKKGHLREQAAKVNRALMPNQQMKHMNKENTPIRQEQSKAGVSPIRIKDVLYCPYPECGCRAELVRVWGVGVTGYYVQCTGDTCGVTGAEGRNIKEGVRNWCRLTVDEPMGWGLFFRVLWHVLFGRKEGRGK